MRAKHGFHCVSPDILQRIDDVDGATLREACAPSKPDDGNKSAALAYSQERRASVLEGQNDMRRLILALAGVAMLAATPATAAPCLRQYDIWNWKSINDKTLILENSRHQKWIAKLMGTCSEFNFRETIAVKSFGGTRLSCVERGDTVFTRNAGFPGRCSITSIEPYTPPAKDHQYDTSPPVRQSY
jgi:hypothetical protein